MISNRKALSLAFFLPAFALLQGCSDNDADQQTVAKKTTEVTKDVAPETAKAEPEKKPADTAAKEVAEAPATQEEPVAEVSPADDGASATPDNPEAMLSSADKLEGDTLESVAFERGPGKPPYVGVWAASPSGCALIDQDVYDSFAVITPDAIRQFEEICSYTPSPATSNVHHLDATCQAEGETSNRVITIEMTNSQTITFQNQEGGNSWEMFRCNLPR